MLLACLAFSFNFMACTDDDGDGDGPEVDDSIRTRTFESADYNSGWKYFSFKKGDFVELTTEQATTRPLRLRTGFRGGIPRKRARLSPPTG